MTFFLKVKWFKGFLVNELLNEEINNIKNNVKFIMETEVYKVKGK